MNEYILLYPLYSPNALQIVGNPPTIDTQNQYQVTQFEGLPTGATDESSDGTDESFEEGDGGGDGDEDVGEETDSDFWQSIIDYFGICEGSGKIKAKTN